MSSSKKILFPTDFSEVSSNALKYTLWFADQIGADVHIVHVIFPETEGLDFPSMAANATQKRVEAASTIFDVFIRTATESLAKEYKLTGDAVKSAEVVIGVPGRAINDTADKMEADMIAMGAKEHHTRFETAFGGIAVSTMVRAHIPVLIIPEETSDLEITNVCYAADLCDADPFHIWETGQMLKDFNPILRIVHVHSLRDKPTEITLPELEGFFAKRTPVLQTTFHEVKGNHVWTELNDFVATNEVNMVVMHAPRRGMLERLRHQSQTKKMALYSHVPLLVLK